jgi:membrane peptidoglycan carboxypeptidase
LAAAFAQSYNAAAVRLAQQVGIPQVIAAAHDLGLHARLANNPSLALGTSEVTLLDLTGAYAAVLAGAAPVEPWAIASVTLSKEQRAVPIGRPHEPQHSLGQYQDDLIELLRGVVGHGTGRAAALPGFAAGKTGTAQDYRDAWFIGFNDSLVVGVWVGNDDHSPMRRVTGGTLPAAIWKRFMEQATPAPSTTMVSQQMYQTARPISPPQKPAVAEQHALNNLFDQSATNAANASCNVPVCERSYRSFRASDCSYQASEGGPRRFCEMQSERTVGVSESPAPTPSTSNRDSGKPATSSEQPRSLWDQKTNDQDAARVAQAAASAKCDVAACQHYSSFRAADCTYQPYGGGPRQLCGRHGERAASTSNRERDAPAAPPFEGRHRDFFADTPDRDGYSVRPAPYRLFSPSFD